MGETRSIRLSFESANSRIIQFRTPSRTRISTQPYSSSDAHSGYASKTGQAGDVSGIVTSAAEGFEEEQIGEFLFIDPGRVVRTVLFQLDPMALPRPLFVGGLREIEKFLTAAGRSTGGIAIARVVRRQIRPGEIIQNRKQRRQHLIVIIVRVILFVDRELNLGPAVDTDAFLDLFVQTLRQTEQTDVFAIKILVVRAGNRHPRLNEIDRDTADVVIVPIGRENLSEPVEKRLQIERLQRRPPGGYFFFGEIFWIGFHFLYLSGGGRP